MKAIEKILQRSWLLLLASLMVLLLSPSAAWGQGIGGEQKDEEDPPATPIPKIRTTKNGTVIDEGDAPTQRPQKGPWPHDVPLPVAEPDRADGEDEAPGVTNGRVASSAVLRLPATVAVEKEGAAAWDKAPVVRRVRPEGSWPHDGPLPVAEPDRPDGEDEVLPAARRSEARSRAEVAAIEAAAMDAEVAAALGAPATQVQRSGVYRVLSVVGPALAGRLPGSALWQSYGKTHVAPALASLQEASSVPKEFALSANYPNPFNPETTIQFALPVSSHVVVEVFDVLGRSIERLVDRELEAGHHQIVFGGGDLASGVYVYRMVAGSFEQNRTMLLVK